MCDQLPPEHFAILKVLLPFLSRVGEHAAENKMTVRNLAVVFGPTILRAKDDDMATIMHDSPKLIQICEFLIENHSTLCSAGAGDPASARALGPESTRSNGGPVADSGPGSPSAEALADGEVASPSLEDEEPGVIADSSDAADVDSGGGVNSTLPSSGPDGAGSHDGGGGNDADDDDEASGNEAGGVYSF